MTSFNRLAAAAVGAIVAWTSTAMGQCLVEDFEGFAVGTPITTQIDGLTFSAVPGTCGGPGSVLPIIVSPGGGTSSGTRGLSLETGCPDFSPDWLVIDFDTPQRWVSFTLGESFGTAGLNFTIRAYNSGGGLISSQSVSPGMGTRTFVSVGGPTGSPNIASIEIQEGISLFECIDDLRWGWDPTPPIARLDAPAYRACACDAIALVGEVCDPDGAYGMDIAEYRPVNGDPEDWTEIGSFTTPLCGGGTLYNWNTAPVPHGTYYVRLTATNACEISNTDVTVVVVDKLPPTAGIDRPAHDDTICGTVEIFGDTNDSCPDGWSLSYAPAGGSYTELASGPGEVHCVITPWDTTTVPDGSYDLRLWAIDACGRETEDVITVFVDNSKGCDCGPDIDGDGVVGINDLLILLAAWGS